MTKEEIEKMEEPVQPVIDDMGRRGQILWVRGLTRLQHQVGNVVRLGSSPIASVSFFSSEPVKYVEYILRQQQQDVYFLLYVFLDGGV